MFKHEGSCIKASRWGCWDADYEGRDECPICERMIDLLHENWNDGTLPFAPYSKSKICIDCHYAVEELKQFPPALLVKLLKKARKWPAVKRHAKK